VNYVRVFVFEFIENWNKINKVNFNGYVNPYVFPLFIILFDFETPDWLILIIAFFAGLVIDMFSGVLGMHTFAIVLMTFIRPFFLKNFPPKTDKKNYPSLKENRFGWMLFYVSTMLFVHHVSYFLIEAGTINNLGNTIVLIFFSLLMSVFISFLLIFTFNNEK